MSDGSASTSTPSTWPMYRALVGVGVFCALAIVTVFQVTLPIIAQNRAEALERAIFQVLPEANSKLSFEHHEDAFQPVEGEPGGGVVHAVFDGEGKLVGFAIEGVGMGYQDNIKLIFGYAVGRDAIIGIQVLESRETPGLDLPGL